MTALQVLIVAATAFVAGFGFGRFSKQRDTPTTRGLTRTKEAAPQVIEQQDGQQITVETGQRLLATGYFMALRNAARKRSGSNDDC